MNKCLYFSNTWILRRQRKTLKIENEKSWIASPPLKSQTLKAQIFGVDYYLSPTAFYKKLTHLDMLEEFLCRKELLFHHSFRQKTVVERPDPSPRLEYPSPKAGLRLDSEVHQTRVSLTNMESKHFPKVFML